jgi:hypothetical protein
MKHEHHEEEQIAYAESGVRVEHEQQYASKEQVAYASVLQAGTIVGFIVLVVAFGLYVFGVVDPYVPLDQLPNYWKLPAKEYLHVAGVPTGWGWTRLVGYGDFMTFVGIAFLSLVTIACYVRLLPMFHANGDKAYLGISILEIVVLTLAASGLLVAGH